MLFSESAYEKQVIFPEKETFFLFFSFFKTLSLRSFVKK
jgi:hypothetical protein